MSKLQRALRQRRTCQQQLQAHRRDGLCAADQLKRLYQRHLGLALGSAAGAGLLSGWHGSRRLRPPTPLLRAAMSWSMLLLRGLF